MLFDTELERDGFQQRSVVRHHGPAQTRTTDRVVEEMPVALVFNGVSQAVMMATPRDLEVFALGFALSEGVVERRDDIYDLALRQNGDSAEVELTICQQAFMRLKERRRTLAGRSGCGVCGVDSLAQLDLQPPRISAPALGQAPAPAVARAARELAQHQLLMQATGGVHAAAWCRPDGAIVHVFEDVGRHNALDKLIGHLARQGEDMRRGFVFLSSRASYELVRKAARMDIPMLATISAPSTLAIDIAERAGIALVSFCREDGCVQYA
jgi:FdhD protein